MIKSLPGWLNFFILGTAYGILLVFLRRVFNSQCEDWFLGIMGAVFCGAYLAKWRFHDGSWHFQ